MAILLSIITICFNEEKTIRNTIDSVLKLKNNDFEYIVKDGGSSDSTNSIVDSYREAFLNKGVEFFHISEKDSGTYDAMNQAVKHCKGEYIIFMNGGDCFNNNYVIDELKKNNNDADICYGDAKMCDTDGDSFFYADMKLIKQRMPFSHQACFVKRKVFNEGFDTKYKICADYDFILRMYFSGKKFNYLDAVVCDYDMNGISSTSFVKKRVEHEEILDKYQLNSPFKHIKNMTEAYIKQIVYLCFPKKFLKPAKKIYCRFFKHYKVIEEKTNF